jgi:hypothetical protein
VVPQERGLTHRVPTGAGYVFCFLFFAKKLEAGDSWKSGNRGFGIIMYYKSPALIKSYLENEAYSHPPKKCSSQITTRNHGESAEGLTFWDHAMGVFNMNVGWDM